MGAGKPKSPQPLEALLAPKLAASAGASLVRSGVATSAAYDQLFACGWPHVIVATPRHPKNRAPREEALAILNYESSYGNLWPSRVLPILIRVKLAARYINGNPNSAETLVHTLSGDSIRSAEGEAIVRENFFENKRGAAHGRLSLFLLEAVIGPDAVAEALIGAIESLDRAALAEYCNHRGIQIWELGFVLLRVGAAAAVSYRDRLEAVFERAQAVYPWTFKKSDGSSSGMVARRLDVLLHGVAGAERSGYRTSVPGNPLASSSLVFVTDDPDWLATQIARQVIDWEEDDFTPFSVRPIYLGGDRAIEIETARWRKYNPAEHEEMIDQMAHFAHPAVATMLGEMALESPAKEAATRQLRARARHR